jgi:hypothetical protein
MRYHLEINPAVIRCENGRSFYHSDTSLADGTLSFNVVDAPHRARVFSLAGARALSARLKSKNVDCRITNQLGEIVDADFADAPPKPQENTRRGMLIPSTPATETRWRAPVLLPDRITLK